MSTETIDHTTLNRLVEAGRYALPMPLAHLAGGR